MTYLEWLRRPPRRRSMKTLLELFAKYQWLEERIGRGLPILISKERQHVYARRLRRRRSSHLALRAAIDEGDSSGIAEDHVKSSIFPQRHVRRWQLLDSHAAPKRTC